MKRGLELSGVGKEYGDFIALRPTDLTVAAGEFMTFLGPSGSGKTTMLMAIAGFVAPSQGKLLLDGRDITHLPPERRDFGVVFQGYALFPHLTVRGNVAFPLRARGLKGPAADAKVEAALDLTQLRRFADRKPSELSGGQQQRVALARALVFEPELLLLDEPLSALDKSLRKDLQSELKDLHRRVGTTFIYVTHDQDEALAMSDRIAILKDGAIQQIDGPRTLYERPRTAFVAGFLGKSNVLSGRVAAAGDGTLDIVSGALHLAVATPERRPVGDAVEIALRPERVRLVSHALLEAANAWSGTIADITYLGSMAEVDIDIRRDGQTSRLTCFVPAVDLDLHQRGAPVWAVCDPAAPVVLGETERGAA
jgi:putative spermidine/putrescine transport system ATP-binding protein